MFLLWTLVVFLTAVIAAMYVKIHPLQKSAREIEEDIADRLVNDTNTLVGISFADKYMRSLADSVSVQLRKLREEQRRFKHDDNELKSAVTNISMTFARP